MERVSWNGEGFAVTTEAQGPGVVSVRVSGELDLASRPAFEDGVTEALDSGCRILLDLSDVSFIDSTGLAAIIRAARRAEKLGAELEIAPGLSPQPQRLFELTGVSAHLPFASPTGRASPRG